MRKKSATILPVRKIGPLSVSAIGLGCMNLSHAYDHIPDEKDAILLLNTALDAGVTLLDTAAIYGGGANERLIAKAVGHRRHEYTLSSKSVLDLIDGKRRLDGRPEAITASLDRSLERLGTDHIDLFYMHRLDKTVPIEESMGALVRAVEAGKIGAIGLSEMSATTIRRAHAVHPIAAVQSEYSPWVRNPDVAVLETCRALRIGFVAFSPVGRGFLTGAMARNDFPPGDIRLTLPRFQSPHFQRNLPLAKAFAALAAGAGITPAQLALAWVLARGPHVVPIPGTRSVEHLRENLFAATLRVSAEVLAEVDSIFTPGAVFGARYQPMMQAQIDTELLPEEL
ncbi:aldo/keto reductase [Sphingobium sp. CR28]|uniref:aldo/keto reductase n=1 Tax=Sphingobium sp. CR28 TaxID=3400272 RepID=UPI003FF128FF